MSDFNYMIRVRNLSKVYCETETHVVALDRVNMDVQQGEFVAIAGPSGSGKSTLLHILGALESPTSGSYELRGKDMAALDDDTLSEIRRTSIGFVFQVFNLIGQLSVLDNVVLPLRYAGVDDPVARKTAFSCLDRVGLSHRTTHLPQQLSGGEQQRTAIARSLAIDPAVLLADEPTGNLDNESGTTILDLFKELHVDGHTIVVVTHDTRVAARANRIITLREGAIVDEVVMA